MSSSNSGGCFSGICAPHNIHSVHNTLRRASASAHRSTAALSMITPAGTAVPDRPGVTWGVEPLFGVGPVSLAGSHSRNYLAFNSAMYLDHGQLPAPSPGGTHAGFWSKLLHRCWRGVGPVSLAGSHSRRALAPMVTLSLGNGMGPAPSPGGTHASIGSSQKKMVLA